MTDSLSSLASGPDEALAHELTACTITPGNPIQISQIKHRLQLLLTWFGGWERAKEALAGKTVVEIGCGQGDMTVVLAHMVAGAGAVSSKGGKVIAIDPAPLDYGSPYTLGDSQAALSASRVGRNIEWIAKDPVDHLPGLQTPPAFIILAHSLLYLPSAEYLSSLLRSCRDAASRDTRLLLAEWGMRASTPAAESHVLAVKAQMESPTPGGNIRLFLDPERIKSLIGETRWQLEGEDWIQTPDLHDGEWEVAHVRQDLSSDAVDTKTKGLMSLMEESIERSGGTVKSMDVWTAVCTF